MIIRFLGFVIFCGIAPGDSIFLVYQLPKLLGIFGIIFIAISEDGLMKFFKNIRESKALYFLGIIWLEIILHNNFRGIEGAKNINDGLFFWLVMTCLYASLPMLSKRQKEDLRSGLIFSCFFCVGVIFFHAISNIEIFGYGKMLTAKRLYGYTFYSWSDHLSVSMVAVIFFLIKNEWQKIIILYSLALIYAKSSVFLGLFSIKNIKLRFLTGIFLIILMMNYRVMLMEKTPRNGLGHRIDKIEATSKKFFRNNNSLLNIRKAGSVYAPMESVMIGKKAIKINDYFQKPVNNEIKKLSNSFIGKITTGRYWLWYINVKFHWQNIVKNPSKFFIGNGSQGILRGNSIILKKPAKPHLLPLDIFISHGLLGVIFYLKFCFNFFGIFGNLILVPWYHSLEFSGILIICYNLRLNFYQFPRIADIVNTIGSANNIFNVSIRKRKL